jgi:hypothetical protein
MTTCGRSIMLCVVWMLVACGGTKEPAESPTSEAPKAGDDAAPEAKVEDGPLTTEGDEAPPETEVIKQELPCPGKKARYWDTGLVQSEVLTSDCEINGQNFKSGRRLDFDEDGQLLTTPD